MIPAAVGARSSIPTGRADKLGAMKIFWVSAAIMAIAFEARAASFDCAKASTAVEKLICSEAKLSDLDGRVAQAYRRALATPAVAQRVKLDQRRWLADRNKCTDVACLTGAYQKRLADLEAAPSTAASRKPTGPQREPSFTTAPFISPRIINDLSTWISDQGEQVVAINLTDSQGSNRYFGDVETRRDGAGTYVGYRTPGDEPGERDAEFGYTHVGRTASGIDVLRTRDSGGGTGVFEYLLLVKLERSETGGEIKWTGGKSGTFTFKKPRLLIRKLGEVGLGDRWEGDIKITGDQIAIGKDRGVQSEVEPSKARIIKIDAAP
jgi:uncharacterized protein